MQKNQQHNPRQLKQQLKHSKSKELKQMLDVFFFIGLLAIGFVGLGLVYKGNQNIPTEASMPFESRGGNNQSALPTASVKLKIEGDLEVFNDKLTFHISPIEKRAKYLIDFGDGTRKKRIKKGSIRHTYKVPRKYPIKVYRVEDKGHKVVYKGKVDIGQAPKPADSYTNIDR